MTKSNYKFTAVSCYVGYIVQAIEANLAPILFIIFKDEYGLSYEKIGRLILINFVTQIFVDVIASKYVKKIGMRTACLFADIFAVCGLVGLSVFPDIFPSPYMGIVAATMLYAFGGGLIEVVVSPTVEALPLGEKSSSMAFLHSFYCWGQVLVVALSTIGLKIIGTESWRFIPLIWAMVPAVNFFMFLRSPFIEAGPEEKTTSLKELMSSKTFPMRCNVYIGAPNLFTPKTIVRSFDVEVDRGDGKWEKLFSCENNYQRLVRVKVGENVKGIRICPTATHGAETARIYEIELL